MSTAIPPSQPPAEQLAAALERLAAWVRMRVWRDAPSAGLAPTQARILELIDRKGALPVSVAARELGISQPTLSESARILKDRGLVEKRSDPADRRASLLSLSPAGREALARRTSPIALHAVISELPADDLAATMRAMSTIIRGLQVRGEIPAQRLCVTCRFFRPNAHPGEAAPHHCAFVDAAFGDAALRVDCHDHEQADPVGEDASWRSFADRSSA